MQKPLLSFFLIIFSFIAVQNVNAQTYYISTIAGDQIAGYNGDGIAATTAELNNPIHTATDKSGNVYIADGFNHRVRVVNTNGIITTFAGNGTGGYMGDGGQATAAELDWPIGLAFDDTGNLYIDDGIGNVIRKVAPNGIITTFAGDGIGSFSGDGGQATDAELADPRGVAVDKFDNVFIADQVNNRIREVNTSGIITTVAGNGTYGYSGDGGPATDAAIANTSNVGVDDSENIYIDDLRNNVIRKVNTKGIISTFAGNGTAGFSGDGGPATDAEINTPEGVVADKAGNVYITDVGSERVRRVDPNGIITTIAGTGVAGHTGDGGPALLAELYSAIGINLDTLGNIYVSENVGGNDDIRKLSVCPLSFTINPPLPPPICNGQSIILTANGGSSYQWSPSLGLNTTTGDSVIANPTVTATYTVTASDSLGCSATQSVVVNVVTAPPLIIQPQLPTVCSGQSIALTVPVSGSDYAWSPFQSLSSSTGDTVVASPSIQTTYTVTGTDSLGCAASGTDVVSISPTPTKPTITRHDSVLTSSATQGNQWVRNDSILQGATNQNYVAAIAGWYIVIAENPANGCSATSDSVYITPTGINQLTVESGRVTVYPNPMGGEVFVNINSSVAEVNDWNLIITDVLGRTVYTKSSLTYSNALDLSNLPSGMYFISVVNKTGRAVIPVVKQ